MASDVGFSIKISGGPEIMARLSLITSGLEDLTEEMDKIGKLTAEYAEGPVFASKGEVLGSTWAKWSPAYEEWRGKHALSNQYLILTGQLHKSFGWNAKSKSVEVGNNTDYWGYLQHGTSKMAARPTIGFSDPLKRGIVKVLSKGITRRLKLI